jgi:hypothetical protein
LAFVEDRQLIELSLSPKKSLFPVLNRAEAMSPWIVLLALIPPLYVLVNRTLTPLDAFWGLKAVQVSASDSAGVWIDPALPRKAAPEIRLKYQPPLSTWLIALVMSVTGTERPLALVLCSFLATAGLIALIFGLADRLRGPQFAWWTTCLVALSGPILLGAQTPAPISLTLAFAVGTSWGFLTHCQDSKRLVSPPLAGAGIAWGLCLLAGGPVALVVVAVLLCYVLSHSQEPKPTKKVNGAKSARAWKGRPALESLGVMLGVGLAVGGWWVVLLFFRYGFEFLGNWFVGGSPVPDVAAWEGGFGRQILRDLSQMGGALTGLAALGAIEGLRMLRDPLEKSQRNGLAFLLAWAGCAAVVWLGLRAGAHQSNAFSPVWRGFCLVPGTMLAALAIEQIGARRIGYFRVFLGLGLTLILLLSLPVEIGFGMVQPGRPLWPSVSLVLEQIFVPESSGLFVLFLRCLFLGSITTVIGWGLWRILHKHDFRQRVFLGTCLGLTALAHGGLGFLAVRQTTLDDRALANLRKDNDPEDDVVRWSIVSPQQTPLRLRFVLTSLWPGVDSYETSSFKDEYLTSDLMEGRGPDGAHIIVDWSDRDSRPPTHRLKDEEDGAHIVEFIPIGTPQILWNHRLRLYRLRDKVYRR